MGTSSGQKWFFLYFVTWQVAFFISFLDKDYQEKRMAGDGRSVLTGTNWN